MDSYREVWTQERIQQKVRDVCAPKILAQEDLEEISTRVLSFLFPDAPPKAIRLSFELRAPGDSAPEPTSWQERAAGAVYFLLQYEIQEQNEINRIEAYAALYRADVGAPVCDWCAGKGVTGTGVLCHLCGGLGRRAVTAEPPIAPTPVPPTDPLDAVAALVDEVPITGSLEDGGVTVAVKGKW